MEWRDERGAGIMKEMENEKNRKKELREPGIEPGAQQWER